MAIMELIFHVSWGWRQSYNSMQSGGTNAFKAMNMWWSSYQTMGITDAERENNWSKVTNGIVVEMWGCATWEKAWEEWAGAVTGHEALHLKLPVSPISQQILAELLLTPLGSWCCQGCPRLGPCTGGIALHKLNAGPWGQFKLLR